MARHRLGFRKTLRQQLEDSNRADRFYALLSGKEPQAQSVLPPKRERAKPVQREAPVVAAISELLAAHPKVLFAVRQNSGMASYEAKSGRYAPVHFYRILTHNTMTITDFWGILKDGRMLAIEAKAPGFSDPRNARECAQYNFLAMVRNCGGVALFATSADQVAEALA